MAKRTHTTMQVHGCVLPCFWGKASDWQGLTADTRLECGSVRLCRYPARRHQSQ